MTTLGNSNSIGCSLSNSSNKIQMMIIRANFFVCMLISGKCVIDALGGSNGFVAVAERIGDSVVDGVVKWPPIRQSRASILQEAAAESAAYPTNFHLTTRLQQEPTTTKTIKWSRVGLGSLQSGGIRRRNRVKQLYGAANGRQQQQQQQQQRNETRLLVDKRFDEDKSKLAYLVSPFSEQILEVGQQLNNFNQNQNQNQPNKLINLDNGWLDLASLAASNYINPEQTNSLQSNVVEFNNEQCLTIRATVQLSKDEMDKSSGQLIRSCKGLVQLNRCDGSCSSTVQPSIKSPIGLVKECFCCNEGSFRRVQVRLDECYSPLDNRRIISSESNDQLMSFMDIEVEEPIDCSCRSCDGVV